VEGVYSKGAGKGALIRRLRRGDLIGVGGDAIDVTGGLMGKLRHAWNIAEMGPRTFMCSIKDLESIEAIIWGNDPPRCTELIP
jgi:Predicted archaeal kinase